MNTSRNAGRLLIRLCWAGLLVWQLAWHALIPEPAGSSNWILALIAFIPLLPLTPGVMKNRHKALAWGMFLAMLYFIVGVMEAWSNPPQRLPAIAQIILTCGFFLGLVLFNRPAPGQAQARVEDLAQDRIQDRIQGRAE